MTLSVITGWTMCYFPYPGSEIDIVYIPAYFLSKAGDLRSGLQRAQISPQLAVKDTAWALYRLDAWCRWIHEYRSAFLPLLQLIFHPGETGKLPVSPQQLLWFWECQKQYTWLVMSSEGSTALTSNLYVPVWQTRNKQLSSLQIVTLDFHLLLNALCRSAA